MNYTGESGVALGWVMLSVHSNVAKGWLSSKLKTQKSGPVPHSGQACFSSAHLSQQEPASLLGLHYPHHSAGTDRDRTEMSPVQEHHWPVCVSLFIKEESQPRLQGDCTFFNSWSTLTRYWLHQQATTGSSFIYKNQKLQNLTESTYIHLRRQQVF